MHLDCIIVFDWNIWDIHVYDGIDGLYGTQVKNTKLNLLYTRSFNLSSNNLYGIQERHFYQFITSRNNQMNEILRMINANRYRRRV